MKQFLFMQDLKSYVTSAANSKSLYFIPTDTFEIHKSSDHSKPKQVLEMMESVWNL